MTIIQSIPLQIKQAYVKECMVGDTTISTLPDNFYGDCLNWFSTASQRIQNDSQLKEISEDDQKANTEFKNTFESVKTIFLTIQRTRLNFIIKHSDQTDVPFLDKISHEEKLLYIELTGTVKKYDIRMTGDLKDV